MALVAAAIGWFLAQFFKIIVNLFVKRKEERTITEILFGSGGMPSSHSATVCALASYITISEGVFSNIAALAIIMSFIVMYDAMNVRQETGRQGAYLNELVDFLDNLDEKLATDKEFKELVGHTPLQVFFGGLLGICVGMGAFFLL